MAKDNLGKAKRAKNDEFYTLYSDVAKELAHYQHHLKGKTVYCNCDNPEQSAFWRYFHINFSAIGLKKLIATYKGTPTYKMEYTGGNDNNIEVGVKTPLQGNGDFRNQECIGLLKESDIVVTNPPFSLFREYVAQLMEYGKKFIIIGNKNSVTYKEIFPLLKDNKVWLGYNSPAEFNTPEGVTKKINGLSRWFTNLDIKKRHEKLVLWKTYTPEEYPKYDNYNVINVNKVAKIPIDYGGVMGVPITFLDNYCEEQFEVIDLLNRYSIYDSQGINDYIKENHLHSCNIDGKATYARILIRRKAVTSDENS